MNDNLESLHEQFESQSATLRQLDLEIHRLEICCRDQDARRDDLRRINNTLKSSNDEIIEHIEIHEETKVCIDREMATQSSVSHRMLLTTETVNDRIKNITVDQDAEILKLDCIIQSSNAQLNKNREATEQLTLLNKEERTMLSMDGT